MIHEILIVEDDKEIRETIIEVLQGSGYPAHGESNGRDALEYLKNPDHRPPFIILDLMMPVMDGFEFQSRKSARPELKDIPVVVMTADGNADSKQLKIGAQAAIRKPVDLDDFLAVIEKFAKDTALH